MKNKIIIFLLLLNFSALSQTIVVRTLDKVGNTADSLKPISNPQKTAINQKLHTVSTVTDLRAYTDANFASFRGVTWERKNGDKADNNIDIIRVSSSFYWERISIKDKFADANSNQIIGDVSTALNATNSNSVFFGTGAGQSNLSGVANVFIGSGAGQYGNNINSSNYIGQFSGTDALNATYSNHIGYSAGYDEIGSSPYFGGNDGLGLYTNEKRIGNRNLSLGRAAGGSKVGDENISIGADANAYFVIGNTVTATITATTKRISATNLATNLGLSGSNLYGIIKIIHPTIISAQADFPHQVKYIDANTVEIRKALLFYVAGTYTSVVINSEKKIDRGIAIGIGTTVQNSDEINIGNILYKSASGNIGIGTNTPTYKLEVNGNASFAGVYVGLGGSGVATNTAVGQFALVSNLSGSQNSIFGRNAGYSITSGSLNVYMGANAGYSATSTNYNTFAGYNSGGSVTTGGGNSLYGSGSGSTLIQGVGNSFYGNDTGLGITTGNYNTIIGSNVSGLSTTLSNTIILADGQGNKRIFVESTGKVGIGTVTPAQTLDVNGTAQATVFKVSAIQTAPATATSTGTTGEIRFTTSGIYVCTATNTWIKCTGATF